VLAQSTPAWFWHVELENTGDSGITCDLIHTQDIALAHYGAIRLNEFYVSQYVDHTPLEHPLRGCAVASRQNQSIGGRCPWMVIGSLGRGVSYSTDALQFHGLSTGSSGSPRATPKAGMESSCPFSQATGATWCFRPRNWQYFVLTDTCCVPAVP
jgi:cellobiose phosphorylase